MNENKKRRDIRPSKGAFAALAIVLLGFALVAYLLLSHQRRVVLLGDSIYAPLDAKQFGSNAVNMGVVADPTARILKRIADIPEDTTDIFLEGGLNDLAYGRYDVALSNYAAIFKALPPAAKIHFAGVLPIDEQHLPAIYAVHVSNKKLAAFNTQIRPLCESRPGCRWMPPPFESMPSSDGIHPDAAGRAILLRWMADELAR